MSELSYSGPRPHITEIDDVSCKKLCQRQRFFTWHDTEAPVGGRYSSGRESGLAESILA